MNTNSLKLLGTEIVCDSVSEMSSESVGGDSSGDAVMLESSEEEQQRIPHPWPYLREMFEIVGSKEHSWKMACKLCLLK